MTEVPGIKVPSVTGSIPDVVGMVLGLADALSAKEGFSYNLCTFSLSSSNDAEDKPAKKKSAALDSPKAPDSAGTSPSNTPTVISDKPVLLEAQGYFGYLDSNKVTARAVIGIRQIKTSTNIICTVSLEVLEGFNTKLGTQMTVEVGAQVCPGGVMLVIKGFLDPADIFGYAHFLGHIFVTLGPSQNSVVTKTIGQLQLVQATTNPGVIRRALIPGGGVIRGQTTDKKFIIQFTA